MRIIDITKFTDEQLDLLVNMIRDEKERRKNGQGPSNYYGRKSIMFENKELVDAFVEKYKDKFITKKTNPNGPLYTVIDMREIGERYKSVLRVKSNGIEYPYKLTFVMKHDDFRMVLIEQDIRYRLFQLNLDNRAKRYPCFNCRTFVGKEIMWNE